MTLLKALERVLFIDSVYDTRVDVFENWMNYAQRISDRSLSATDASVSIAKDFSKSIENISPFEGSFMTRFSFYEWNKIRYFLFEYEQNLLASSKTKRSKLKWEDFANEDYDYDHKTIEHIFPQRATAKCWTDQFHQFTLSQRKSLINSLGNLVPLSNRKNSSLSNKCFDAKKGSNKSKIGYSYGCYSEIEVAQNEQWTAREILLRGLKLLDFLETHWDVFLGGHIKKVKILGLDFLLTSMPQLKHEIDSIYLKD